MAGMFKRRITNPAQWLPCWSDTAALLRECAEKQRAAVVQAERIRATVARVKAIGVTPPFNDVCSLLENTVDALKGHDHD